MWYKDRVTAETSDDKSNPTEAKTTAKPAERRPVTAAGARGRTRRPRQHRPPAPPTGEEINDLPVLAVRDTVLFPRMQAPLFVGRERSLRAIEEALAGDRTLLVVAQRDSEVEDVEAADLHSVGTEANIIRALKMPDGSTSVLVQGQRRLRVLEYGPGDNHLRARVTPIVEHEEKNVQTEALRRATLALFEKCVRLSRTIPDEAYVAAINIDELGWLADFIAGTMELPVPNRQEILEIAVAASGRRAGDVELEPLIVFEQVIPIVRTKSCVAPADIIVPLILVLVGDNDYVGTPRIRQAIPIGIVRCGEVDRLSLEGIGHGQLDVAHLVGVALEGDHRADQLQRALGFLHARIDRLLALLRREKSG